MKTAIVIWYICAAIWLIGSVIFLAFLVREKTNIESPVVVQDQDPDYGLVIVTEEYK